MSSITVPELKKLMQDNPDFVLIDIRNESEVNNGKIPKALWISLSDREFMNKINALPKEGSYCLYCASGGRSSMAVSFMQESGFKNVFDLKGGIVSWLLAGNELV